MKVGNFERYCCGIKNCWSIDQGSGTSAARRCALMNSAAGLFIRFSGLQFLDLNLSHMQYGLRVAPPSAVLL